MTVLQLVSASAAYPSTFVLREVQELRRRGLDMVIGQLRPVFGNMSTTGFDDLSSIVVKPRSVFLDLFAGIVYWGWKQPYRLWQYIILILRSGPQLENLIKMLYVLLASVIIAQKCRGSQIGHVRAHFLHTEAVGAYFVGGLLGIPYSITVHTVAVHFGPVLIRKVLESGAFFVADTHQVREFLQTRGVPSERIRLVRNGVPVEEFNFRDNRGASNPPVVLAAGYFTPKKGFDILLTACSLLFQRGVPFRCVLIGDGQERENLTRLRHKLCLENQVEMPGDLSFGELRDWYYRATLFVMPSVVLSNGSTDGLPTVVIEALACGTPVIGTDTAGIPEVILDGKTGLLAPAGDPEAIADRIQMLLAQDMLRESLAREGRRLIEREFDLRKTSESIVDLILSEGIIKAVPFPSTLN